MTVHEFSIIAGGRDAFADGFEDRFFEAGCDDATISLQRGAIILDFSREAASFDAAVASALHDITRAGAVPERVEPDHLVSLSDIARRAGLTRAAISNYAHGERRARFPTPISRVTSDSPLWDWAAVAEWLHAEGAVSDDALARARSVRDVNARLAGGGRAGYALDDTVAPA